MTEYQVTSWREIPSLVVAREGDTVVKVQLPNRFQEAIDEAAMRLGDVGADAYLEGWVRSPWIPAEGPPHDVAHSVGLALSEEFSESRIAELLAALGQGDVE